MIVDAEQSRQFDLLVVPLSGASGICETFFALHPVEGIMAKEGAQ